MLKLNKKAPNFSLKDKNGKYYSLDSFKSKFLVLYFYPKDSTPGCTLEAKEFSGLIKKFEKINTKVIGISGGNKNSKEKFCKENNLKIILLSDEDFSVSKKYGVYKKKEFIGRKFFGIKRTTFILNNKKRIIKIYNNVKVQRHAKEVFKYIISQ
ncbi:MAG: peroxiredoxin [Candidatus Pacearchaeota archaeon]